jgi:hypothetical protein
MDARNILTGDAAIEYAERHGKTLNKYSDPLQGARQGVTVDRAREIAREDPGLIWIEDLLTQQPYLLVQEKGWLAEPMDEYWMTTVVRFNAIELAQYQSGMMSNGGNWGTRIFPIARQAARNPDCYFMRDVHAAIKLLDAALNAHDLISTEGYRKTTRIYHYLCRQYEMESMK